MLIIDASPPKLFTPADISTALWLDASDSSTITLNGSNVSQWRDKSGKNRHVTQSTTFRQPAYVLNGLNGLPVLRATGQSLSSANLTGFSGGPALWVILVGVMTSNAQNFARLVSYCLPGLPDHNNAQSTALFLRNSTNSAFQSYRNGSALATSPLTYNVPFLGAQIYTGSQNLSYRDGILNQTVGSQTANFTSAPRIDVFFHGGSSDSYWDGTVGEILLGDQVLSELNRQRIEGYLAWKWGLTANLPTTHLFKNRPPLTTDI